MINGRFLPLINDNFILEEMVDAIEIETGFDDFISYFLVSSKANKIFYVIIYLSVGYANEGFYVAKKFKLKKPAQKWIKKNSPK